MGKTAQRRRRRFDELVADEHIYDPDAADADDLGRFVLIERSRYDCDIFVTSWNDPVDAADYHDGQEEPNDWPIEKLVDLDTGRELAPIVTTTWT